MERNDFKYSLQLALIAATTVISAFAAMPVFFYSNTYRLILFSVWIIYFITNIFLHKTSLTPVGIAIIISWALYAAYCATMYLIHRDGYLNGTYFYSISLSVFIFINGCFLSHNKAKKVFDTITVIYNICSVIVVLYVYLTNFWSVEYFKVQTYIYGPKNSLGPIIVANLVILAIREAGNKGLVKFARFCTIGFLVYILFLINNRAGIVELAAVLLCYLLFSEKRPHIKLSGHQKKLAVLVILVLGWILTMAIILQGQNIIEKSSGFLKWALKLDLINDLDKFSSGRISLYYLAIENAIKASPLLGVGFWYTDFFYLSIIAEIGLIGFIPISVIIFLIIATAFKFIKSKETYPKLLGVLCIQMLTATFFEGLPPFGPGTVVFVFWLLFGAYAGSQSRAVGEMGSRKCIRDL